MDLPHVKDGKFRTLMHLAQEAGWTIDRTGGNHVRMTPPSGRGHVMFSSTKPSSPRTYANVRANARRHGLDV